MGIKIVPIPGRTTPKNGLPSVFIGDIDPAWWADEGSMGEFERVGQEERSLDNPPLKSNRKKKPMIKHKPGKP